MPTETIGLLIAKILSRVFFGDTAHAILSDIGVAAKEMRANNREHQAYARTFETIADQIDERLEPLTEREFSDLDAGDRSAAIDALKATLTSESANISTLMNVNFDTTAVDKILWTKMQSISESVGLGETGQSFARLLTIEAASTISAFAPELPKFAELAMLESLGRQSKLLEAASRIAASLPGPEVPIQWGAGSEDDRFESQYKSAVAQYANELRIFGVNSSLAKRRYPLEIAYIGLEVETAAKSSKSSRGGSVVSSAIRTPDQLLKSSTQILLHGNAGGGKTTLLRWVAMLAMKPLQDVDYGAWGGKVPFVVPLRQYSETSLPQPEDFVRAIASNLAGAMPHGWAHRVLAANRAVLLVDGLDELRPERRNEVREWLQSFLTTFRETPILLTSRSTALDDEWHALSGFTEAALLPMDRSAMKRFIEGWHDAAATFALDPLELASIEDSRKDLQVLLQESRPIRQLFDTPLLAALICALNAESGANLPDNRMDLYRTALEMLFFGRDNSRDIESDSRRLSFSDTQVLLRSFAGWMHDGGMTDADEEDYRRKIVEKVSRISSDGLEPEAIPQMLLERSGVLRSPVVGRVDFVHRTFLEYLAADEFVNDNAISKLLGHARDDYWHEVIVMSAGHANRKQAARLLEGLLDKAEEDPTSRHQLILLAAACLETALELAPSLRQRVTDALLKTLPPRSIREAKSVAAAGDLAVQRLRNVSGDVNAVRACVRALTLINTEEAFEAIGTYANDKRITIFRELLRSWSYFDEAEFAANVLDFSPLVRQSLPIATAKQLVASGKMSNVGDINVFVLDRPGVSWDQLSRARHENIADLTVFSSEASFDTAPPMGRLKELTIASAGTLLSISGVSKFQQLTNLRIVGWGPRSGISLQSADVGMKLQTLVIHGLAVSGLDQFLENNSVRILFLSGPLQPASSVSLSGVSAFEYAGEIPSEFTFHHAQDLVSLTLEGRIEGDLTVPDSVKDLKVADFAGVFVGGRGVENLAFSKISSPRNFERNIRGLPNVDSVSLSQYSDEHLPRLLRVLVDDTRIHEISLPRTASTRSLKIEGFESAGHRERYRVVLRRNNSG